MAEYNPPSEQRVPRPLILWGIYGATISSLRRNFESAQSYMDLEGIKVSPPRPYSEVSFPHIIVSVKYEVNASSFYPVDLQMSANENRDLVLLSKGTITLKVYAKNQTWLISIQDFITQLYMLNILYEESFFYPGTEAEYINIGLEPGHLEWTEIQQEQNVVDDNYTDKVYSCSCSFGFEADHSATYELDKISAIDIEAIPKMVLEG